MDAAGAGATEDVDARSFDTDTADVLDDERDISLAPALPETESWLQTATINTEHTDAAQCFHTHLLQRALATAVA